VPAICREDAKGPPVRIRSAFHNTMYSLAVSAPFNLFVVVVVVINTVQMIMLTSAYEQVMHGPCSNAVNDVVFLSGLERNCVFKKSF